MESSQWENLNYLFSPKASFWNVLLVLFSQVIKKICFLWIDTVGAPRLTTFPLLSISYWMYTLKLKFFMIISIFFLWIPFYAIISNTVFICVCEKSWVHTFRILVTIVSHTTHSNRKLCEIRSSFTRNLIFHKIPDDSIEKYSISHVKPQLSVKWKMNDRIQFSS